ncbi:MAG: class II aldolase/adducin family protein [Actinobacteria bacterium]|nr:class II aldolase/adducin family protein [Actinomycetota bacterium]
MAMLRAREVVTGLCKRMLPDGLGVGSAGNISARDGDEVLITPRGVQYDVLQPHMLCVVDPDGRPVEAERTPSTDTSLHLAVYRGTEAGGVVHTHSRYAAALGCLTDELPRVHYLMADLGGPVAVVPYGPTESAETQRGVLAALAGRSAVLLGNHGALTVGDSPQDAYRRAVYLEWVASVWFVARSLGEPALLSQDDLAQVSMLLEGYFDDSR